MGLERHGDEILGRDPGCHVVVSVDVPEIDAGLKMQYSGECARLATINRIRRFLKYVYYLSNHRVRSLPTEQ